MAEFDTSPEVKAAIAKRKATQVATWQTKNLNATGQAQGAEYLSQMKADAAIQSQSNLVNTVEQSRADNSALAEVNSFWEWLYGILKSLNTPVNPIEEQQQTMTDLVTQSNAQNADLLNNLPNTQNSEEVLKAQMEANEKQKQLNDLNSSIDQLYNDARHNMKWASESYIQAYVASKTRDLLPQRNQLINELQLAQGNAQALKEQQQVDRQNQRQEIGFKYQINQDQFNKTWEVMSKWFDAQQQEYARQMSFNDQVKMTVINQKIQQDYDQIKFDKEQKAAASIRAEEFANQQSMALFNYQLDMQKQGTQTSIFNTNDWKAVLYNTQTGDVVKTFNLWMSVEDQLKYQDLQPVYGWAGELSTSAYNAAVQNCLAAWGKQCWQFVNDYLQNMGDARVMGDTLESKAKNINSTVPIAGAVFVQPSSEYSANWHTGIVKSVNWDGTITVIETNLKGDKQLGERTISQSSVQGYYVPKSLYQEFQNAQPVNANKSLSGYARGVLDNGMNVNNIPEKQREQTLNEIYSFLGQETKNITDPGLKSVLMSGIKSKDIDATQLKTITQIKTVDAQLDGIIQSLGEQTTDPIVDVFRSKNSYDEKRQALQAQVNAILPWLARGVFSEVGVLTDADIDRYTKLVPNANKTGGVNQLIGEMLKKVLYKNYTTTLTTLSQASNVRGFASDYDTYMTKLYKMDRNDVSYTPWQLLASDKWPIVVDKKKVVVPWLQWPYKATPVQMQIPKTVSRI